MDRNIAGLLKDLGEKNVPEGLDLAVFSRIEKSMRSKYLFKTIVGSMLSLFSIIALIPLVSYTHSELYQSGFSNYLSLLFSDGSIVVNNFGSYAMSIVDSIPFLAITSILLLVQILFISVRSLFNFSFKGKLVRSALNY